MNTAPHRIQVAVAHADPLVAIGLATVLGRQHDMVVAASVDDGAGRPHMPGAHARHEGLVVDISLADIIVADYDQGLAVAAQQARCPHGALGLRGAAARSGAPRGWPSRVLIVSAQDREYDVRRALEAGVDGYLELGCAVPELLHGVRQLARGARYLSPAAAGRMADSLHRSSLTPRELEVLRLLAQGQSNKAIALVLAITLGTVKAHLKALMGKLGAASRTEAASIAIARGLVAPRHAD